MLPWLVKSLLQAGCCPLEGYVCHYLCYFATTHLCCSAGNMLLDWCLCSSSFLLFVSHCLRVISLSALNHLLWCLTVDLYFSLVYGEVSGSFSLQPLLSTQRSYPKVAFNINCRCEIGSLLLSLGACFIIVHSCECKSVISVNGFLC